MLLNYVSVPFLVLTYTLPVQCEFISLGVASGIGLLSSIGGYLGYEKFYKCQYHECCTDEYINTDLDKLEDMLATKLYGQQIAQETIMNVLRGHLNAYNSPKALGISFHGTPGTGKNYVAQMIATAYYKKGIQSQFYHFFNGRNDFPLQRKVEEYKEELRNIIVNSLKECERSIFVFDEVDKMPEGLLNVLVPFLDYNRYSKSSKNNEMMCQNKAIFIFLSNTGSTQIVDHFAALWQKGKRRKDMKLQDFEKLIANGAFSEKGGFHHSDAIQSSVIDYYVPFLPLEEVHVKKCIKHAFAERNVLYPTEEMIQEVLSHLTFGPEPYYLYSMAGCKRIDQKVASIVYRDKHKSKFSFKSNDEDDTKVRHDDDDDDNNKVQVHFL